MALLSDGLPQLPDGRILAIAEGVVDIAHLPGRIQSNFSRGVQPHQNHILMQDVDFWINFLKAAALPVGAFILILLILRITGVIGKKK